MEKSETWEDIGTAHFSTESGKLEMVGFAFNQSWYDRLGEMLKRDFPQFDIEEDKDLEGFIVRMKSTNPLQTPWAVFTVYCSGGHYGYTLYEAIADIWQGIDMEDEKLVCKNQPIGVIRDEMNRIIRSWENNQETFSAPSESIFDEGI